MNFSDLDIKTILNLLVIGNFAQPAIFSFYKNIPGNRRPYWHFMGGRTLQGAGWLLLSLRGSIPDLLSAYLGNLLLLSGIAFETFSMTAVGRPDSRTGHACFSIAAAGIALFFIFATKPHLWVGFASATAAALFLLASVSLLRVPDFSFISIRKILGLLCGVTALSLALRTWNGFFSRSDFSLMSRNHVQTAAFTSMFLMLIIGSSGFLLLFKEQADKVIDESEKKYRLLVEKANEAICIIQERKIVFANGKLSKLIGVLNENLIGRVFTDFIHPDDIQMVSSYYDRRDEKSGDIPDVFSFRVMNRERPVWVQISSTDIDYLGKCSTLALLSDINTLKLAEEAVKESRRQFQGLVETMYDWVWEVDAEGIYTYASPQVKSILGYEVEEIIGKTPFDLMPPEESKRILERFGSFISEKKPITAMENENTHKDGHRVIIETNGAPFYDDEGNFKGYRGTDRDITRRKRAEDDLRQNRRFLSELIEHSGTLIAVKDRESRYELVNRKWEETMGIARKDALGKTDEELFPGTTGRQFRANDREVMQSESAQEREEFYDEGGIKRFFLSVKFPLRNAENEITGICAMITEITERKKAEERILHMANHDLLTDLPSMRLAKDRLILSILRARRSGCRLAVMFIDLDGFKAVNDTMGHDAGDYVLKEIAGRLLSCVRESDTVARAGGDEFLIIADQIRVRDNAAQIADTIVRLVPQPVTYNGGQTLVGTSIGIALYPDDGEEMNQLIKEADKAMYRIKRQGKNGYCFASEKNGKQGNLD